MSAMLRFLLIGLILLGSLYLLLRYSPYWTYRLCDRTLTNRRDRLTVEYEKPRYFTLDQEAKLDTSARWPGWDGWYFFVLPDDKTLPVKMIRAGLMTGLYGLEGVDNYERILMRLPSFNVAEYLSFIPTEKIIAGKIAQENFLSHHYVPKSSDLEMNHTKLDVSIIGPRVASDEENQTYGRISGTWPHYYMQFVNPEAEISLDLAFQGTNLIWWADIPGIFTYFTVFGDFKGRIVYGRGTKLDNAHQIGDKEEAYSINGRGGFEHGFARKFFEFNKPWFPIGLLIKALRKTFIRYHYEILIGDDGLEGGFVKAQALGIPIRNHGGIYLDGHYQHIQSVQVIYSVDPVPEEVDTHCYGKPRVVFYRRWKIQAKTENGLLEYTATREWPPATISPHMMYYNFLYEGKYSGKAIRGRGYGEYLHM
jgi:hypothetical protein